ncbi:MAG: ABC transporter permease [Acidimicrobiia bacterium]|nr:ABC transporter permease [Acidimicrobiia bacterium]
MSNLRSVLGIARVSVIRFTRERSNIFFVFALPLLVILFIGMQFGGGNFSEVALVGADGPVGARVAEAFDSSDIVASPYDTRAEALRAVEEQKVEAAIIVPTTDPFTGPLDIEFLSSREGIDARALLQSTIDEIAIDVDSAHFLASNLGGQPGDYAGQAAAVDATLGPISVTESTAGENILGDVTQFNIGAATQVVLFTFLSSLTASSYLILTRQLGVAQRMAASSTGIGTIVIGETLGKYLISLLQAVYIVIATWVIFGVDWGNLWATGALIAVFSLVGTAASILLGSMVNNEGVASGIGVGLGIGLGALGGAMMPSEFFSEGVRNVARFTPHYWALEGLKDVVWRGGTIGDVTTELGVLGAFAAVLLVVSMVLYRRTLLRS